MRTTSAPHDGLEHGHRLRTVIATATAVLLTAALPMTSADADEGNDCDGIELAVEISGAVDDDGLAFAQGSTITIDGLTATYSGGEDCTVPDDHRFVIDGSGPDDLGPEGEDVATALFGDAGLAAIVAADQLGRSSVGDNVEGKVFTSLNDLTLTIEEEAPLGEYTLRYFLVTGGTNGSFTPVDLNEDNPLESTFTIVEPTPAPTPSPEPAPSAPPAAAPVEQPAGGAQFVDASGTPIEPTTTVADGALTVSAGGFETTVAGDGGATAASGPVTSGSGSFTTTIEGDVPEGSVVEVWMFSEPRLVAAGLSDGGGTLSIDVPTGEPLDGGDPIPAGTHTMQLLIPTDSGLVAMNVGVTIGGPVPTVVPAGEGPSPIGAFVLAALLAVGGVALMGRRTLVGPTA